MSSQTAGNSSQSVRGRGADLLVRSLTRAGVKVIYSLSGNQIMPVYDACIDAGIRIVHCRHEGAAVFMADAHAQLTGEVGIALVTAAPGFANALGAAYCARMSESPVVILSGDSPVGRDGDGAFQELDQNAIAAPLVKLALRPRKPADLGHMLARAIRAARSGRPGPVQMALPFDLLNATIAGDAIPAQGDFLAEIRPADAQALAAILADLKEAACPLILTGPALNASRGRSVLTGLADRLDLPVIAMESPRGLKDPALGALAQALGRADCVLLLGKAIDFTLNFGEGGTFGAAAQVHVIDPDPAMRDRARRKLGGKAGLVLDGDAPATAAALSRLAGSGAGSRRLAWRTQVAALLAERVAAPDTGNRISPHAFARAIDRALGRDSDAVLLSDGGEIGQWVQHLATAPHRIINGPSGAIGGVLCQGIAAKLLKPRARVLAAMGDGTVGFHFAELDTAAREGANLVVVVGNDGLWNAEHQIQLRDYGADRLIGCTLAPGRRYDLAAQGLGCAGFHVTQAGDLDGALEAAFRAGRPALVNVEIEGLPAPSLGGGVSGH